MNPAIPLSVPADFTEEPIQPPVLGQRTTVNPGIIPGMFRGNGERVLLRSRMLETSAAQRRALDGEAKQAASAIAEQEKGVAEIQKVLQDQLLAMTSAGAPQMEKPVVSLEDSLSVLLGGLFGQDVGQLANVATDRAKVEAQRRFENARASFADQREMGRLQMGMTQDRLTQKLADIREMRSRRDRFEEASMNLDAQASRDLLDFDIKTAGLQEAWNQFLAENAEFDRRQGIAKAAGNEDAQVKFLQGALAENANPADTDALIAALEELQGKPMSKRLRQFFISKSIDNEAALKQKEELVNSQIAENNRIPTVRTRQDSATGYSPENPMTGNLNAAFGGDTLPSAQNPSAGNPVGDAITFAMSDPSPLSKLISGQAAYPAFYGKDGTIEERWAKILSTASKRGSVGAVKDIDEAALTYAEANINLTALPLQDQIAVGTAIANAMKGKSSFPDSIPSVNAGSYAVSPADAKRIKADIEEFRKNQDQNQKAQKDLDAAFKANARVLAGVPGYLDFAVVLLDKTVGKIGAIKGNSPSDKAAKENLRLKFEQATGLPWDTVDAERSLRLKKQKK